jgi:hypothetical protein
MGPLPTTGLFNPRVWGHEIDYAGSVPMLPGQYRTATIWARCVLLALVEVGQIPRLDVERTRAHAETSITGKWDPGFAPSRTIDMTTFRADALNGLLEGDSMDPANNVHDSALIERVYAFLMEKEVRTSGAASPENLPMVTNLKGMIGRVEALINNRPEVTWGPTTGQRNALHHELAQIRAAQIELAAKVESLQVAGVDVVQLATLLAPLMAKAVNDDADQRARDNDPATGPRS